MASWRWSTEGVGGSVVDIGSAVAFVAIGVSGSHAEQ